MSVEPDIPRSKTTEENNVGANIFSGTHAARDDSGECEQLRLITTKDGRYFSNPSWRLFSLYDPKYHSVEKQAYARCDICGKDVKMYKPSRGDKPQVAGLTAHLKAVHSREYAELMVKHGKSSGEGSGGVRLKFHQADFNRFEGRSGENDFGRRTQSEVSNRDKNGENDERIEDNPNLHGKEVNEKQQIEWMDSWDNARTRLNRLIREFHEEHDEFIRADIKDDATKMRKRKAHFEDLLGMKA